MKDIKNILSIRNKEERYDKLINWISSEIFQNKGAILELNKFSEKRKMRRNRKKLIAVVIFSKDSESSASKGPAIAFKIFERQTTKVWHIDLRFTSLVSGLKSTVTIYENLDFKKFINYERVKLMREFILN